MKLGAKGQYAVMAMLDLAMHKKSQPISLQLVSQRQNIPLQYLEKLCAKLRQEGLIASHRGTNGGYILAKKPEEIDIYQILKAVDEEIHTTRCKNGRFCTGSNTPCLTHDLWEQLGRQVKSFLTSISLADLSERKKISIKDTFSPTLFDHSSFNGV